MLTQVCTIHGKSVASASTMSVNNPAKGKHFAQVPKLTLKDLDDAVASARSAFQGWSLVPYEQRVEKCRHVAQVLEDNAAELAQLLTQEQGKPYAGLGSHFEVAQLINWIRATAELELPIKHLQDDFFGPIEIHRTPIGVIGSITPWNWPLMIAIWHIMPAVQAGNAVVCKPSPYTPVSTLRMVELINHVLPPGVVNVISGEDSLGAAMSRHQGIDKIVFTGSTATGKKVMSSASDTLKNVILELGGNDAAILLADVDVEALAPQLFWSAFINNGQTCACLKRLYVPSAIYQDLCDAMVAFAQSIKLGDAEDSDDIELGPLQNKMQFDIVNDLVKRSIALGGKVLIGGAIDQPDTLFFPPTLIATSNPEDPLVTEEQFGPALPIIPYDDLDTAIALANSSVNGLGSSVWTKDKEQARAIAMRLESGTVWINGHGGLQPNAPFGGIKQSGIGVQFGIEGLLANTNIKSIFVG